MSDQLSRRAVLRIGMGVAVGVTAACAPARPPAAEPPAALAPTSVSGSFTSVARGGLKTNWVISRPPGQSGRLRPVVLLHGMDGSAQGITDMMNVERVLAAGRQAGDPPVAVVAVDGGNTYWHRRTSGEDSGDMVLNELIPMLSRHGLDTSRVGFLGWSMGGYGAMLLGSRLGPQRTAAICAVSPALWTSPTQTTPGSYDGPADYDANSVWGLARLDPIPLRIDCGTEDRFYPATEQFVAQLHPAPAGGFAPGGHDFTYWRAQFGPELSWMAPLLVA